MTIPSLVRYCATPSHYRVPDFSKFIGIDVMTTMEHISRYLIQLRDASVEEAHKV
jgi:hypothetical protein